MAHSNTVADTRDSEEKRNTLAIADSALNKTLQIAHAYMPGDKVSKSQPNIFIASGAFHTAKPSDLLPELQGRLPIRVELKPLTRDDLRRILTEPEASLIKQYIALMRTEGLELEFSEEAIDAVADTAVAVNSSVENIGARRLQTVMERVLDDVSFSASDRSGETVKIDAVYVQEHVGDLAKNTDLSRFIL